MTQVTDTMIQHHLQKIKELAGDDAGVMVMVFSAHTRPFLHMSGPGKYITGGLAQGLGNDWQLQKLVADALEIAQNKKL